MTGECKPACPQLGAACSLPGPRALCRGPSWHPAPRFGLRWPQGCPGAGPGPDGEGQCGSVGGFEGTGAAVRAASCRDGPGGGAIAAQEEEPCEEEAALGALGQPYGRAASLRAGDGGLPPHACPGVQDGWGASSGSAPGLSGHVCGLREAGSALHPSARVSSGQQATIRVLTRALSTEPSPGPLWPDEVLWRAERARCAHVAHFSAHPQSRAHTHQARGACRAPTLSPTRGGSCARLAAR